MKIIFLFLALFFFSCFLSFSQQISISSQAFLEQAGVHKRFNCGLIELDNRAAGLDIRNQFRACKGILKTDISFISEGNAALTIITHDKDYKDIFINAMIHIGFEKVYLDAVELKTTEIFDRLNRMENQ